jgi:hypothetical protein
VTRYIFHAMVSARENHRGPNGYVRIECVGFMPRDDSDGGALAAVQEAIEHIMPGRVVAYAVRIVNDDPAATKLRQGAA